MSNPVMLAAIVKSVISSDTIVLRNTVVAPGQVPKERTLHLEGVTGPRVGSRDRPEEARAFEAREHLRALLVNKPVTFAVTHTAQSQSASPVEFGILKANGGQIDVALEVVRAGWAKVREGRGNNNAAAEEEEGSRRGLLKQAEEEAKRAGRGLWSENEVKDRLVSFSMPEDGAAFLEQHKDKPIEAVVEAVLNGSTVRVRLILNDEEHQIVSLGLAGLRSPRSGKLTGDPSGEDFGDEARLFVESRLLQRYVSVTLLSMPTSQTTQAANGTTSATMYLGTIQSPAGNIANLLVSSGLARIVDWHAGFLSQSPFPNTMSELRQAEATAKNARRGIWSSLPLPASGSASANDGRPKWSGIVTRIWSADSIGVTKTGEQNERRIQLSSVRQPKPSDPRVAGLQVEGKEALRKKLIGKQVYVTLDYVKPAEGDYEERECATVRTQNGQNVAENLVERGLLSLIRHRQNDDQRSSDYDRLMAAEAKAVSEQRGVHQSDKELPAPRIVDASESIQKAAPFLSSFKRAGKTAGIVDFVSSGSRFKVYVPKQQIKLTLVLGGIRCPRTARNASEKGEPFGAEAAAFASRSFLQRDCEFEVDTNDKAGGFIGRLYINREDAALALVREGLARVDDYAVDRKDLWQAQELAQREKKNLWQSYVPEANGAQAAATNGKQAPAARKEYIDIIVSDVRPRTDLTPFSFAVQVLRDGGIPELEKMMSELTLHHSDADSATVNFVPRSGDLVSARFTADDSWYRAKVKRSNPVKKEAEVLYLDYGNSEIIPFSRLQPLAQQFRDLEGQAKDATLSFVNLLGPETEYGQDAIERFREVCEGRQLVANVDYREANLMHLSLFDPKDPASLSSQGASINVALVREGLARVDRKCRYAAAYPAVIKALEEAVREAKRTRAGAYELGDIFDDDE